MRPSLPASAPCPVCASRPPSATGVPADYLTDLSDQADPKSVLKSLIVDGEDHTNDWSISDFTMAELKQWIGGTTYDAANERPKVFNGKLPIISFQDVIDIAKVKSKETGRSILVYPETKNPTWNNAQAIANGCGAAGSRPLEDALIKIIGDNGLNTKDAPILVQSFEPGSLKYMRSHGLQTAAGPTRRRQRNRLQNRQGSPQQHHEFAPVRLDGCGRCALVRCDADARGACRDQDLCRGHRSVEGLYRSAQDRAVEGQQRRWHRPTRDRRRRLRRRTRPALSRTRTSSVFSSMSSRFGTRRSILPPTIAATRALEYLKFYRLGVDGVFSDFTYTGVAARAAYLRELGW